MRPTRNRLIYLSLIVAESSWLFAACRLFGALFGIGRSPLSWPAIFGLLAASALTTSRLHPIRIPIGVVRGLQAAAGATAIYLTLATQLTLGAEIDLAWPASIGDKASDPRYISSVVVGTLFALGLWWRGSRIATMGPLKEALKTTFQIGIVVIAAAAIVDISSSLDLKAALIAFPFFGANLAGLALSHMASSEQGVFRGGTWLRTIVGAVGGILTLGIVLSLVRGGFLSGFVSAVSKVINVIFDVLFYVILVPLSFIVSFLIRSLLYIMEWLSGGNVDRETLQQVQQGALEIGERNTENASAAFIGDVFLWVLLGLLILAALYFLARAFRLRGYRVEDSDEGVRESLWSEAQPREDLNAILLGLLPKSLRNPRRAKGFKIPQEEWGIVEAFRIYFRLLSKAARMGHPRTEWQTPREYQGTLQRLLPDEPVELATNAFIRACYGHIPATNQEIEKMASALADLEGGQKKR